MANFAQLRSGVRTRIGTPANDGFFTDLVVGELVNEALQVVSTEFDWPWLQATTTFNTTAGTATYSVPSDWIQTKALYITNFEPMILTPLQDIDQIIAQGRPLQYVIYGEQIVLRPIPDATYTVNHQYYKQEPALASDTETPIMPSQFHGSIMEYASYLAHLRAHQPDRAQSSMQAYDGFLRRMRQHRRRVTAPMKVRVRPGSWL